MRLTKLDQLYPLAANRESGFYAYGWQNNSPGSDRWARIGVVANFDQNHHVRASVDWGNRNRGEKRGCNLSNAAPYFGI